MEIVALCALCLAAGLVVGYEWAEWRGRRADAPAPVQMDFDRANPINAKYRETVEECGVEWTVMK